MLIAWMDSIITRAAVPLSIPASTVTYVSCRPIMPTFDEKSARTSSLFACPHACLTDERAFRCEGGACRIVITNNKGHSWCTSPLFQRWSSIIHCKRSEEMPRARRISWMWVHTEDEENVYKLDCSVDGAAVEESVDDQGHGPFYRRDSSGGKSNCSIVFRSRLFPVGSIRGEVTQHIVRRDWIVLEM